MSSNFSPSLRLELIGDGDQSGIWGQTTNQNLGALIEQAITGVVTIDMLDTNYVMSNFNGVVDESRNAVIVAGGTLTQQRNLVAPLVEKVYFVRNNTVGGFSVQVIGSSGTGVVVPNGQAMPIYCDGTSFYPLNTGSAANYRVAGNLSVAGTTTLTGALNGSSGAFSGTVSGANFIGAGTGLTGTATVLSIGGNAATATLATNATNATTAATCSGNAATATSPQSGGSFITSNNIASQSVNYANSAGSAGSAGSASSATIAAKASTLANGGGNGAAMTFNWSGLGGTPSYVWGGSDGTNMYVYQPSNFSVNYANSAGSATNATNATNATTASSANALNAGNSYNCVNLTASGYLYASGNVSAYSDERLKTNWRPVQQDFVAKLAQVKSGIYDRTDVVLTQAGVSAQDLQKLLSETVSVDADGLLSVNYGAAALVSAIELAKQVEVLKAEIAELKRGK